MDAEVLRALAKWPDVPDCYGWLYLSARGEWYIGARNARCERITHRGLVEFIDRNYAVDERGAWFFQNGPQRVYVELEKTPFVYSLCGDAHDALATHTGARVTLLREAWLDSEGCLILRSEHGCGVVLDRDLAAVLRRVTNATGSLAADDALERLAGSAEAPAEGGLFLSLCGTQVSIGRIERGALESLCGFIPMPAPAEAR